MSDVSVPGFGKQKKQTVYIIGGVVVAVIGIGYYRSRKNAAATAAATTATAATDTSSATDTSGSGYVDPNAAYDSSAYGSGYVDPTTGLPLNTGVTQPTGFTSNSQWSQAAEEYLAGTVGLDATSVQAALGKYITGGSVTADQQNIIEQAIAAEGYPPQSGPNGYPPSVQLAATPPPTQAAPPPPTAAPAGSYLGGQFYRNIGNGAIYEVVGGKRYHVTAATWARIGASGQRPKTGWYKEILPSDPVMKLPNGGNI